MTKITKVSPYVVLSDGCGSWGIADKNAAAMPAINTWYNLGGINFSDEEVYQDALHKVAAHMNTAHNEAYKMAKIELTDRIVGLMFNDQPAKVYMTELTEDEHEYISNCRAEEGR